MTYKKYKILDITLITLLILFSEVINIFILKKKFATVNYFIPSITTALSMVVIIRWGKLGVIPAVIASVFSTFFSQEQGLYYLINCGGAFAVAIGLIWIKFLGYKKIKESITLTILYFSSGYLAVAILKGILSIAIYHTFMQNIIHYIIFDAFSCLVGVLLGLIIRKQNGFMENQKDYLFRIQEEQKNNSRNIEYI